MEVEKTYSLKKPFCFMQKEYTDSSSLAEAFLKEWDIAVSVFRRGDLLHFWTEYTEDAGATGQEAAEYFRYAYDKMWENAKTEDVLFQNVLYYLAPSLTSDALVPYYYGVERVEKKKIAGWIAIQYEDYKYKPLPARPPKAYSPCYIGQCWIEAAIEEGVPWICDIVQKNPRGE